MIYTLGCSFTKWHWPTWSDWLVAYSDQSVTNLAYPGHTNQQIYYQLLSLTDAIGPDDTVYIAWGHSHRVSCWYDREWIDQHDVLGFFPNTQGKLWHGHESYQGLWKCHPDYQPSVTEMIVNNWDIIFKTQLLLNQIGCTYRMMFVQNPWMDTREQHIPEYQSSWDRKDIISPEDIDRARCLMKIAPVSQMLKSIDWQKFVMESVDPTDPVSYTGIWDFMLSRKEYVVLAHDTDNHPNALVHHDWAISILNTEPVLRDQAVRIATAALDMKIPEWTAENCIIGATATLNQWPITVDC